MRKRKCQLILRVVCFTVTTIVCASLLCTRSGDETSSTRLLSLLTYSGKLFSGHRQVPPSFNYERVVLLVAFDRYEYFQQALHALASAKGSGSYTLIVALDGLKPGAEENTLDGQMKIIAFTRSIQDKLLFKNVILSMSETNLGVWKNKKRGVALAFEYTDFVIVLEDDITIADDGLQWFEWHVLSGLIFEHDDIVTASCWSASFATAQGLPTWDYDIKMAEELQLRSRWVKSKWPHQWGWAIWRKTWEDFGDGWNGQDQNLSRAIQARGLFESHPLLARCNNVGAYGVNKKGLLDGHVHSRSITSRDTNRFGELDYSNPRCWPKQLIGQTLHDINPAELYPWVRGGIGKYHSSPITFPTIQKRVNTIRQAHYSWAKLPC